MRRIPFKAAGIVVGALCVASTASASDAKIYSGHMCVESNAASPSIRYLYHGGAQNSATSARKFFCPVVRDNGGAILQVDLTVGRDCSNYTEPWTIEVWSMALNGLSGQVKTKLVPTACMPSDITFSITDDVPSGSAGGGVWIASTVPAKADIRRYHVTEA